LAHRNWSFVRRLLVKGPAGEALAAPLGSHGTHACDRQHPLNSSPPASVQPRSAYLPGQGRGVDTIRRAQFLYLDVSAIQQATRK